MAPKSTRSRRRRGPRFCPLSERDVVNSEYGGFPRKENIQRECSCPSTVPDQSGDLSHHLSSSKEQLLQRMRKSPSGDPIGDTFDGNETSGDSKSPKADKKKPNSLARFLLAKSKLFQKKRSPTEVPEPNPAADDTVVYEDVLNGSPDRKHNENDTSSSNAGNESSDNGQIAKTGASEDRQTADLDHHQKPREKTSENEIRPFPISLDADIAASSKKKTTPLPFTEIMKYQRRNSGSSDVSSLSGAGAKTRDIPLEYYLAMDMRERASTRMFCEDILNIAGQDTLQLQRSHSTENSAWEVLPTCLILLTDPMQRIFEMVSVMYAPKKDTVAKILKRCTKNAKDDRLKKQTYVGLAYGGDHCTLDMIPQDTIRKSVADCKPLMAIPAKYSAHQIQIVGKSLLASPSVQTLLDHQLKSMGLSQHNSDSKKKEPELPITQIVVPPKRTSRKLDTA